VTVSFLVRLVPGALAQARIVGHVTAISTGAVAPVRSADDLIAFLLASGQATPVPATPDPAMTDAGTPVTPTPLRPDSGPARQVRGADAPEES
jgi:hypothetical protein